MALKHRDQFHRNIILWDEITNLYANLSGDEVKLPLEHGGISSFHLHSIQSIAYP